MKPGHIFQITSAIIDNNYKKYKHNKLFPNYIEQNHIYKKSNYLSSDIITIYDYNNSELNNSVTDILQKDINNKLFLGPESIYITMLLSNQLNIPSMCIGLIGDINHEKDKNYINKDYEIKIITYFLQKNFPKKNKMWSVIFN